MANFLTLNGIVVPCLEEGGGEQEVEQVGESKRAVDGTMRIHRRVIKRKWSFTMVHQEVATALAFRDLVLGRGHYWSFDDSVKWAYSSKGLGPASLTGLSRGTTGPTPIVGAGSLRVAAAGTPNTFVATIGAGAPGITVAAWRNLNNGGWTHYMKDDGGNVWTAGVLTGSAAFFTINLSTGQVTLTGDASFSCDFDELMILPYRLPSDWPLQMYNFTLGGQQPGLADVKAAGDGVDGQLTGIRCMGGIAGMPIMPGTKTAASGFKPNLHKMKFTLEEI